jgi:hypothetical protein
MASSTSSNTTSSVVRDPSQQPQSISLISTQTTELQQDTEGECLPFFVDLSKLNRNSLEHLRDTGLLPAGSDKNVDLDVDVDVDVDVDNHEQDSSEHAHEHEHALEICLLRHKHLEYLSRVFTPSKQPLGYSMVSLDASRPWMMYWTLHGTDLMLLPTPTVEKQDNKGANGCSLLYETVGDDALCAIVDTLQACWQSIDIELPSHFNLTPKDRELLEPKPPRNNSSNSNDDDSKADGTSYTGGGFGGGPGQMAHSAVAYAAVLTLCIVATSEGPLSSHRAWRLLELIRKPCYAWLLSLQQSNGGFRMHHDGEVDVRGKQHQDEPINNDGCYCALCI